MDSDIVVISVRFRDSRVGYGTARFCEAAVDQEFMSRLTPVNKVILQGIAAKAAAPPIQTRTARAAATAAAAETAASKKKIGRPKKQLLSDDAVSSAKAISVTRKPIGKIPPPSHDNEVTEAHRSALSSKVDPATVQSSSSNQSLSLPPANVLRSQKFVTELLAHLQQHLVSPSSSLAPLLEEFAAACKSPGASHSHSTASVPSSPRTRSGSTEGVRATHDLWLCLELLGFFRPVSSTDPLSALEEVLRLRDIGNPTPRTLKFTPLELQEDSQQCNPGDTSGDDISQLSDTLKEEMWRHHLALNRLIVALRKLTIESPSFWDSVGGKRAGSSAEGVAKGKKRRVEGEEAATERNL